MRIGVLTTSYPRREGDAAGAFVAGFSRWLAANVGDVDVVCADAARPLFYRGGAPEALRQRRWGEAAAFSARLLVESAWRARRWDAVVSHWLVPAGAVGDACARGGRRHLAIAHGSDVRLLSSLPGGQALVRHLGRRADLVYVADALRVAGAPGRVVAMAIDVAPIAAATGSDARTAARARLDLDGFVVLFLGRLIHDKGVDLLIDALPAHATLLVAGDGPEREALARRVGERRVRFVGHVAGADKLALLAAADVLAIPSRLDGAPTVALEGLAAGLPIVATRAGGLPELLDESTTLFCDAHAPALAAALTRLRDDGPLRAAMSSCSRAVAPAHDWSQVAPCLWNDSVRPIAGCIRTIRV